MKNKANEAIARSDYDAEIGSIVGDISNSSDLSAACLAAEKHLGNLGHDLLSVFFCDSLDQKPAIRPYRKLPKVLSDLAVKLNAMGGCPVKREVQKVLHPFDWFSMPEPSKDDFLGARFMSEARKLGYQEILAVPIVLGRGIAVFSVGLGQGNGEGAKRERVISTVSQICCAIIGRFPELSVLFEPKRLSTLQAETLMLMSQGNDGDKIGRILGLSPITVSLIYASAAECLGTSSEAQTVERAISTGEISSMEIGDHDLI